MGGQSRAIVVYHDDGRRRVAEEYIAALDEEGGYDDEVVTEVERLETFYRAEEKHQDYFEKSPADAYCTMNAQPKVEKVRERFREKVKA